MATILIIEDEMPIAELIKDALEGAGFSAVTAPTLSEGIAKYKSISPDAVTLDIALPDDTGINFLKFIKHNPDTASVPVIVISASGEEDSATKNGAADYFDKPINFSKLIISLRRHLFAH